MRLASYNAFLSGCNAGIYGEVQARQGEVTRINLNEDVFRGVFNQLPKNVETPKIKKYYPVVAASGANQRELLSTTLNTPLVAKFDAGKGFIYLQAVPLQADFSDPRQPPYLRRWCITVPCTKKNNQPV